MRVLVFTSHYPASDAPTRGTYNHSTFRALARHADLRVIGPVPWWTRASRPRELFTARREARFGLDASFPSYWSIPGVTFLHARAAHLSLVPHVKRLRAEFPWDIIVATWAYPDAAAAASFADDHGTPLVATVLGTDINELPRNPLLRPQIRRALGRAQRVVAVSRPMVPRLVDLGVPRDRVVVQQNGVDGATFSIRDRTEARRRVGLAHDRPVVLYVGNIKEGKGCRVLVDAMASLAQRPGAADAELCVVGSGDIEGELRARARSLGVEHRVRFCGRRLHTEIPSWMNACDLLCLPSYMEGCPNVILEALASGRPVVASRVGGIPDLLCEDNGILVPPGDPEALAGALAAALTRTWSPEALRRSVPYLSWEAVGDRYRDLLVEALDEWRTRPATAASNIVGAQTI